MTPIADDTQPVQLSQAEFQELLHEKLRQAVQVALVAILEEEVTAGRRPWRTSSSVGFRR